ncbi:RING finger protein nhl-1 [Agrilus planipennis]|uniref:RING finger protein nhl-1 n=1 Tax=Agrilus planipennis TaxID=224129 RepID=A0A1W4XIV0_AGRPL|nr:RING finger protein nhl-1 [Agrilus planipennis]XP_018335906.1 RING finger protein nhl-1 [Agrilus planipennis]XP_025828972.1 RING finger protein nhl-1 [Agrilus planipennis]
MEQFEQLLTCAICLDRYRNPKLLPCQHSFCMEPCLEGLVDYVRRQVKCPECRAEHRIPYQGIQGFPTNVTLQRFLELHIEITGELPDPTSGQVMERCNVCSEKAYCSYCHHCEKKVCPDCKGAHMDILRREITRINNQIRRSIHRLQDSLSLVEKNTQNIQVNCLSVSEEVEEIYRRLSKALKDRTDYLRGEIDRYLGTELRGLTGLKDNLEQEISNILSNCDLADKHITENADWDDCELMDAKEIFLRTVEFIRNFEYENSDYSRKVRLILAHDPNQLVLHVAGFGDLNIANLPSFGQTSSALQPSTPGLMRSKSDHRLATQFRQQEERSGYDRGYGEGGQEELPLGGRKFGDRHIKPAVDKYDRYSRSGAADYGDDYEEGVRPSRNRYRSRFTRHAAGDNDSDAEQSSRGVRFSEHQQKERERSLDTEEVTRGPLSGIQRLADSPRVMKKLQDFETNKKKEKDAPPPTQPTIQPKVAPKKPPTTRQVSEEDEISKIKKQNKGATTSATETTETRPPAPERVAALKREETEDRHGNRKTPASEAVTSEEESDVSVSTLQARKQAQQQTKTATPPARRPSVETPPVVHKKTRSTSSDSSASTESSGSSSAVRNTGAAYTTEEVKQKILSKGTAENVADSQKTKSVAPTATTQKPFQSRFLPNRQPTTPAAITKEEEDESETSSEEETETEEETDNESTSKPPDKSMANTDIGALLARSAQARDNTSEASIRSVNRDSPTGRYRSKPAEEDYSYSSRALNKSKTTSGVQNDDDSKYGSTYSTPDDDKYSSSRSRYAALKDRRQRLARSRSTHTFGDDDEVDEPISPTTANPTAYLTSRGYGSSTSSGNDIARSRSSHALKSRESSPDRNIGAEKDGAAMSSWARYLKNKYGNRSGTKDKDSGASGVGSSSSSSAAARRLSLGLPLRSSTDLGSSDDDQKNTEGSPTTPTAATVAAAGTIAAAGTSPRSQYLQKCHLLFKIGGRGSEPGLFTWPRGVAVGPDNTIVVADSSNHRVQVFDANGNFLKEFGQYGNAEGEFDCLAGVAVNRIGQYIIADRYNHRIQVFDPSGRFLRAFGSQGTADGRFNYPWGITTDALGFIYVCDKENHRVQVFQSDGTFVGKFGTMGNKPGQLEHPHYIAVSNTNRVVVSDSNNHRIQIFDVNGRVLSSFGSEGANDGQFKFPRGVAVDDQGYIIVADSGNNRIQVFNPDGSFLRAFGCWGARDGEFKGLEGVAVTSSGNILVCDRENHRIQVF